MPRLSKALEPKVGFLLSAGGAAFARSVRLFGWSPDRFHVVCDRNCGALAEVSDLGICSETVLGVSRTEISIKAASAFERAKCTVVITHFSRLVGPELFDRILTVNVHPALLPAYPGIDGVGNAARDGAPIQGATLHVVDAGMDSGPILAQTARVSPSNAELEWRHALAYRQKVVMSLVMLDWLKHGLVNTSLKGKEAFDMGAVPTGDMLCTPGFVSTKTRLSAASLFDDLEETSV